LICHPSPPRRPTAGLRSLLLLLGAFAYSPVSHAADVDFQGYYRARDQIFSTLSVDSSLPGALGTSAWIEHRFWLRPRILINDKIGVFADIKGLDNVVWGQQPAPWFDPASGGSQPLVYTDDLTAPTSATDPTVPLFDLTLWHVWGEVHLGNQSFKIGRMPLQWGAGVWQNDGLGFNGEYGDTADRIQWEGLVNDQIYTSLAFDVNSRGLVNQTDATWSMNGMAAWRTEQVKAGVNLQYRRSVSSDVGQNPFDLFTADLALDGTLGPLTFRLEALAHTGSGDFDTGLNDITVAAGGGVVDLGLTTPNFDARFRYALATGDKNPTDSHLKTFTFDRDYNFGLILFEQPMPTLAASASSTVTDPNGIYDYSLTQTGIGVSNAMIFAPEISRTVFDKVKFKAMGVFAMPAAHPTTPTYVHRRYYGSEIDVSAAYVGLEHLDLVLTGAAFIPGGYITNVDNLGLNGTVFGGQLNVRFGF